jgi:hypothetical protein
MRLTMFLAGVTACIAAVVAGNIPNPVPPAAACVLQVPDADAPGAAVAMATFRRAYGPLEYRPEGIWLDRIGREVGYSADEDGPICVVRVAP